MESSAAPTVDSKTHALHVTSDEVANHFAQFTPDVRDMVLEHPTDGADVKARVAVVDKLCVNWKPWFGRQLRESLPVLNGNDVRDAIVFLRQSPKRRSVQLQPDSAGHSSPWWAYGQP